MSVCTIAPGRVNLIGEHTDYTGGFVLPMAISLVTSATIMPTNDGLYHFDSELFSETRTMSPDDRSGKANTWSDYPVGVLRELQKLGIEPPLFALTLHGNVPRGAGLSSSASVEMATAMALLRHSGMTLKSEEIVALCRRAENVYVGSPCGIMDQFVIAYAKRGHALLLNTRDLAYQHLPLNRGTLAECVIVVANSGVRHSIAGGSYGLRRRELEAGQDVLLAQYPKLRDLGDASLSQLASCESMMQPESYRRCRHVISENSRTLRASAAMIAGDPLWLGALMTQAHRSERDDFECSIAEIDFLVSTAIELPGCYGARLTGGGFGGCTVNLVKAAEAETFSSSLSVAYRERWACDLSIYVCEAADGAMARAEAEQKVMEVQD